jgi:hypothetical protein
MVTAILALGASYKRRLQIKHAMIAAMLACALVNVLLARGVSGEISQIVGPAK